MKTIYFFAIYFTLSGASFAVPIIGDAIDDAKVAADGVVANAAVESRALANHTANRLYVTAENLRVAFANDLRKETEKLDLLGKNAFGHLENLTATANEATKTAFDLKDSATIDMMNIMDGLPLSGHRPPYIKRIDGLNWIKKASPAGDYKIDIVGYGFGLNHDTACVAVYSENNIVRTQSQRRVDAHTLEFSAKDVDSWFDSKGVATKTLTLEFINKPKKPWWKVFGKVEPLILEYKVRVTLLPQKAFTLTGVYEHSVTKVKKLRRDRESFTAPNRHGLGDAWTTFTWDLAEPNTFGGERSVYYDRKQKPPHNYWVFSTLAPSWQPEVERPQLSLSNGGRRLSVAIKNHGPPFIFYIESDIYGPATTTRQANLSVDAFYGRTLTVEVKTPNAFLTKLKLADGSERDLVLGSSSPYAIFKQVTPLANGGRSYFYDVPYPPSSSY